jgi:hypothetical protein
VLAGVAEGWQPDQKHEKQSAVIHSLCSNGFWIHFVLKYLRGKFDILRVHTYVSPRDEDLARPPTRQPANTKLRPGPRWTGGHQSPVVNVARRTSSFNH